MAKDRVLITLEVDSKGAVKQIDTFKGKVQEVPGATKKAGTGLSSLTKVLGGLAAAFAAVGVSRFMRETISAAADQQKVFTLLASSMGNAGVAFNDVSGELQTMLGHLQDTTRYGDTDTAAALQKLVAVTGDYESSLKLLGPTIDFAAAMQIDLATAARLSGQAASGMASTLSRYGIILDDTTKKQLAQADAAGKAEIMARVLNSKFGGAAQADLNTYSGRIARMGNYWGDFKEAIGDVIVKSAAMPAAFDAITNAIISAIGWAQTFGETMVLLTNLDWDVTLSIGLDKLIGAAKLKIRDLYLSLSALPDALGGAGFLDKALAINDELIELGDTIDRQFAPSLKKAMEAVEDYRRASANLTTVNGDVTTTIEEVAEAAEETETYFAKFSLNVDKLSDRFSLFDNETGTVTDSLEAAAGQSMVLSDTFGELYFATDHVSIGTKKAAGEFENLKYGFSSLISKGFVGELTSFADLWSDIWSDLAKSMTTELLKGFQTAFAEGGSLGKVISNFMDNVKAETKGEKLAAGAAIAGAAYNAYQTGGGGKEGALAGAMSGAMAGMALGPWGALAGAFIGGIAGYFGKSDDGPSSYGTISMPTGTGRLNLGGQSMTDDAEVLWIRDRVSEYRAAIRGMNDVLRLFGSEDLFGMLGEGMRNWSFDEDVGIDQIAAIFREKVIPEAMRKIFKGAIDTGLGDIGVDADTITRLWAEIDELNAGEQTAALSTFIGSLVDAVDLYASMDWQTMLDETRQGSMQTFLGGMSDALDAVRMDMLGLDQMTLLERGEQATRINALINSARQAEIGMLQQIDALQRSINDSIDSQIEGLRVGGMSDEQQQSYYRQQIESIMAELRGGVSSPEQVERLMADLSRYVSSYQGALGDDLYATYGIGTTPADDLVRILEEARGLSNDAFETMRDQMRESNELLMAELDRLINALTHFGDSVATGGQVPVDVDVDIDIEIGVAPNSMFELWIDQRIERHFYRDAGGIN